MKRAIRLFAYLMPGLALAVGVIGWSVFLKPHRHRIPQWDRIWFEPKQERGAFKSFRLERDAIIAETEPWPHKHPRANSYLRSFEAFAGDVEVSMTVVFRNQRFPNSRYLGCYLCYDDQTDSGYWLATGHAIGNYAKKAYIKIVRNGDWKTMARGDLEIIPGQPYRLRFRRRDQALSVLVDERMVVTWTNNEFDRGRVQLRLHNTEAEIRHLRIDGQTSHGKLAQ